MYSELDNLIGEAFLKISWPAWASLISYQFRLHRNDGPLGVVRGSWGNVELVTLTL